MYSSRVTFVRNIIDPGQFVQILEGDILHSRTERQFQNDWVTS